MKTYQCRDCGHPYRSTAPSAPVIALHRAVSHSGKPPILEIRNPAPRRVRSDMRVHAPSANIPRGALYLLIQFPRVTSTYPGRAPLWEWTTARAVEIGVTS